jgi:hypothetical protein
MYGSQYTPAAGIAFNFTGTGGGVVGGGAVRADPAVVHAARRSANTIFTCV